jgi:predicted 3-demethylubiquinone-9 3-methyltransferase (glyoxalase superfamily)
MKGDKAMQNNQKISPFLWFINQAEEAARFYTAIFPDSRVDRVVKTTVDTPGAKIGQVLLVDFTLAGQKYQALNGGPHDQFNDAISLVAHCQDQAEVDRLWDALTKDGGKPVACGWLKDKFGVSWQITPTVLIEMLAGSDGAKAKRAMEAMMGMVKLDIAQLQRAYDGA